MKIRTLFVATFVPTTIALTGCGGAPGEEDTSSSSADLTSIGDTISNNARANVGKGACSTNSFGTKGYYTSCTGNGGQPEFWCADFARSMWYHSGVQHTDELSAAAGSFYVYGQKYNTLHSHPKVGDAVVFDYHGGGSADHVAIVTYVTSDGKGIDTVSGDWDGESGTEAQFASTSHVIRNTPHYDDAIGDVPGIMGMKISGYISPVN